MPNQDKKTSVDSTLKKIEERLNTLEDRETLTQLDMVNLRNELEKLKIMTPSPLTPEEEEKIVELKKLSKHADLFKKWEQTVNEVKLLRSEIGSVDAKKAKELLDLLKERGEEIKRGKPLLDDFKKGINKSIEELKTMIESKPLKAKPLKDWGSLRTDINQNRKAIEELRNMLISMPLEGVISDSKKFKSILSSNRKAISELDKKISMLPKVRAEKPEELESLKKKTDDLNSRINLLDKKLKIETSLKPISLPEGLEVPVSGEDIGKKLEVLRGEIENVIRRMERDESFMKNFARRDELESIKRGQKAFGFLNMLKGKGKPEPGMQVDVNKIMGRLTANENKIQRILTELQNIKERIKSKKGFEGLLPSKVRSSEIDDLRRKIEELELKLGMVHTTSPVIIE